MFPTTSFSFTAENVNTKSPQTFNLKGKKQLPYSPSMSVGRSECVCACLCTNHSIKTLNGMFYLTTQSHK